MGIITVKHKGNFKNTEKFFKRSLNKEYRKILDRYGRAGVDILRDATPKESGITANTWDYHIEEGDGTTSVVWTNNHENKGIYIAVLLIYGHGLANGGYVKGNDFVTPAIRSLIDELAEQVWREVTK